ncbi:Uncharacterised protein [Serratia odorifera]|uniref:Uncharacterized protein n=1 Tax=Serratia odorifera TaxID=618 RepID=A0A3S4DR24_SEROD|nr:Uncharacterised protein [Serratia odorifera]
MDWFTLAIVLVLVAFCGGVLLFAWLMLNVISD